MTVILKDDECDNGMSRDKPLLILFDGNALIHRAFHALPPLTVVRTGEMINAVQGFASMLLKLLRENKPDYWAIAFDRHAPTFRHQLFEDYKAQRPKMPDELVTQVDRVHQLADAFNLPVFELDGYEADDIIGTLSKQAAVRGIDTLIVTGDNDMLQIAGQDTKVMLPRRGFADTVVYDDAAVREKYGLNPNQLISYKALVGDASDNIPGIKGIGDRTAIKLLQQYNDIDGIYAHINEIEPEKLRQLLQSAKDQVLKNRKLATIVTDVPVPFDIDKCAVSSYDRNKVVELFHELGFSALLSRLPTEIGGSSASAAVQLPSMENHHTIVSRESLDNFALRLAYAGTFAISVVSSGNSAMRDSLVGIAISPAKGEAYYIPVGHRTLSTDEQLPLSQVLTVLQSYLEQDNFARIAYDGKFDIVLLARNGVKLHHIVFDPLIAAYLLGEKSLKLKSLAFSRMKMEVPTISDIRGTGTKQVSPALVSVETVSNIACAEVDIAFRLKETLEKDLRAMDLWKLFNEVEMPLVPLLAEMELNGVLLDKALLMEMSSSLGAEILRLEQEIYNAVGHQFKINSPQQLSHVLFNELRLQSGRKTSSGFSTDAATLEELKGTHPVIDLILQYRQLSKLKSTYTDALPQLVNPVTGRLHTSFNQTGTVTGRLSSSEPNLQNLPVRGELGGKIRQSIIAPPCWQLLSADYSQIDLRVLAHLSQDAELIATFIRDEDVHTHTASEVFGVPDSEVTPQMRRVAKTVNFGIIYGMSGYGLEQATNLTRQEAELFINTYFSRYPGVKAYIERTKQQAMEMGYVQTVLGRRRYIPEIRSPNRIAREAAERMAINMPIQGTSADIIKIAMIDMHREMVKQEMQTHMILQVHDELVFEVPPEEMDMLKKLAKEIMPNAIQLCVPLKIDIKTGKNWGEMS